MSSRYPPTYTLVINMPHYSGGILVTHSFEHAKETGEEWYRTCEVVLSDPDWEEVYYEIYEISEHLPKSVYIGPRS